MNKPMRPQAQEVSRYDRQSPETMARHAANLKRMRDNGALQCKQEPEKYCSCGCGECGK